MRPSHLFSVLAFLVAVLLSWRVLLLQQLSFDVLGCRWCVVPNVVAADSFYLAGVLSAWVVAMLVNAWWWRVGWRLLALAGVFFYTADLLVMSQFGTRLLVADIRVYGEDLALSWSIVTQWPWPLQGGLLVVTGVAFWLLVQPLKDTLAWRRAFVSVAGLLCGGGLLWALLSPADYVHQWALENVVTANRSSGGSVAYSDEARARAAASRPIQQCTAGRNQRDHVVVLLLESWSTYHSQRWLGVNDWTPRLDALAGEGVWFEQLHAGGFNTNEGLVSLLTGRDIVLPVLPAHQMGAFEGAWQAEHTLPTALNALGYHTALLTSGDLAYTRKGEWLNAVGFNEALGHDMPAFEGHPRLHFAAVEDKLLYDAAFDYIREQRQGASPSFVMVENVSSHHPFIHPTTGERSEQAVFEYMDDTAADFIERLLADGFLDEGLLVVVSDHRAMTFITPEEREMLGRGAASRIPGFVMARDVTATGVSEPVHQADLLPTVLRRVAGELCWPTPMRDWLAHEDIEPRCLLHARGDQRDRVDVFCPTGEGTVAVAGDDSAFIDVEGISRDEQQRVLASILRQRLGLFP